MIFNESAKNEEILHFVQNDKKDVQNDKKDVQNDVDCSEQC